MRRLGPEPREGFVAAEQAACGCEVLGECSVCAPAEADRLEAEAWATWEKAAPVGSRQKGQR